MKIISSAALAWLAFVALLAAAPSATAQNDRRPNVLVILADDK
jgi:hypothetical protein